MSTLAGVILFLATLIVVFLMPVCAWLHVETAPLSHHVSNVNLLSHSLRVSVMVPVFQEPTQLTLKHQPTVHVRDVLLIATHAHRTATASPVISLLTTGLSATTDVLPSQATTRTT